MQCSGLHQRSFVRPDNIRALAVVRSDVLKPERAGKGDAPKAGAELAPYMCILSSDATCAVIRARVCVVDAFVPWHLTGICLDCRHLKKETIEQRAERSREFEVKLSILSDLLAKKEPSPSELRLVGRSSKPSHWSNAATRELKIEGLVGAL